ncbi:MAG: hypothetical protein AB1921_05575 [Thermodesulfobacteriota bacterium]
MPDKPRRDRIFGFLLLAVLAWHIAYVVRHLSSDYLFFVCYAANLLLALGLIFRSGLPVGVGFGWALIALPLWLRESFRTHDWELSCTVFHLAGVVLGGLALPGYKLPRLTCVWAVLLGLFLQGASRLFTDEALNINAAFRVYEGWDTVFHSYPLYVLSMTLGFGLFFCALTFVNNRLLYGRF